MYEQLKPAKSHEVFFQVADSTQPSRCARKLTTMSFVESPVVEGLADLVLQGIDVSFVFIDENGKGEGPISRGDVARKGGDAGDVAGFGADMAGDFHAFE